MKRILFILGLTLVFILNSCSTDKEDESIPAPSPTIDRSKMFGMCALPKIYNLGSADPGVTPEMIATLCQKMNVKAFRIWMHLTWIMELDQATGKPIFKEENLKEFKTFATLLKENGVENILLMSHTYLYPVGFSASTTSVVPLPGTEEYIEFLELLETCYEMLAVEFPDIKYFEPGNETNGHTGKYLAKPGYIMGATIEDNAPYLYTLDELAFITTDMCYYVQKGIKAVDEKNQLVFPGMTNDFDYARDFLDYSYQSIETGKLPTTREDASTGKRKLPVDKDPDHYFNYLNWHPYVYAQYDTRWLEGNKSIYQVAVNHNDANRKVLLTEFGFFDSNVNNRKEAIPDYCMDAMDALERTLPTLETIYMFRMFNWASAGTSVAAAEKTFGLFTSPYESEGVVPKPVALSLFFRYNGKTADPNSLFLYAN